MTPESPADLRARLTPLATAATAGEWTFDWEDDCQVVYVNGESLAYLDERKDADAAFIVELLSKWPAIDAMLARLETAEADADRLAESLDDWYCRNCDGRKCMDCVLRYVHEACEDDCLECCEHERIVCSHRLPEKHARRDEALRLHRHALDHRGRL